MSGLLNPNGKFEIFNYQNLGKVRVHIDNKGKPWFCLSDVASVLNISSHNTIVTRLDRGGICIIDTPTLQRNQYNVEYFANTQLNYVNEPNLYRVIFQSRKPEARKFQDWIFNEVLPIINRTGAYLTDETIAQLENNPSHINDILSENKRLRNENEELQSKLEAYNSYAREKDGQINELWDRLAEYEDIDEYYDD